MNPQDPYQPRQPYQPQPTPQTPSLPTQNGQYNVVPPIVANSSTNGHNPYEFIFNEQAQKPAPSSMLKRILLVIIGIAILAVVFAVVSSLLRAGSGAGQEQLKTISLQQQEILLLATDGTKYIIDPALKNAATTLQLSTTTSQAELFGYAAKNGLTIDPKELALLHDSATDKLLADAKATSTYDVTWKQTARAQLEEHATAVKKLYDQSTNTEFKKLLQTAYDNTVLVHSQLKE